MSADNIIDVHPETGEVIETETALARRPEDAFMPALSIEQARDRYERFRAFVQSQMREGTDFGTIPGTPKPTLYKPGAEKICTLFGLSARFEMADKHEDWQGGVFFYRYRCSLWRGDWLLAEAEGSCNNREKKYLKRDPYDVLNTVCKMAQKRALVAAALIAGNASEFFTQDMEDHHPAAPADPVARVLSDLVTPKQLVAIRAVANANGCDAEKLSLEMFSARPEELTKRCASELIDAIKEGRKPAPRVAEPLAAEPSAEDRKRSKLGEALAAMGHVSREGDEFEVTTTGRARATLRVWRGEDGRVRCSCAEFAEAEAGFRCAHILAVKYYLEPPAAETGAEERVTAGEAADLRSLFEGAKVGAEEWLRSRGIESGRCEDCTVRVFNEATRSLVS